MNNKKYNILLLIGHLVLGIILYQFTSFSTYYGTIVILMGTYYILVKHDPLEKFPLLFSVYIVGLEVLLRMTGAKLFWEFGKYAIIYFLFIGLIRANKKVHIPPPIILYFISLLPAIIHVPFHTFNIWRQDVAFNLSGPAVLTLCSIYLFNRKINKQMLLEMLFVMILPIISISIYNILIMPDLSTYRFMPYSDFYTSGGFGPNQISTIFGLGVSGMFVSQILLLQPQVGAPLKT